MFDETIMAYRRLFYEADGVTLTPDARRVLADLEAVCFQISSLVSSDSTGAVDPLRTLYNEGRRSAYLHIKRQLARNPEH